MKIGHIQVNLRVLAQILRLPQDVQIIGVEDFNAEQCVLRLGGNLPANGELIANYDFEHTTILKFRGFEVPVQKALS